MDVELKEIHTKCPHCTEVEELRNQVKSLMERVSQLENIVLEKKPQSTNSMLVCEFV